MLILVVEDNAVLAFMIEDALVEAGHDVLGPVGASAEAIALAEQFRPQLAIVDVDLERDTSGIDVARHLAASTVTASLFSTGQIEVARRNADFAVGVLSKPYPPETIVRAVAAVSQKLAGQMPTDMPRELELF